MSKKQLVIWGMIIVLLLLGAGTAWYLNRSNPAAALANVAATTTATTAAALPPDGVQPDDKAFGSPKAPLVMIEYFSQICSVCSRFDQDVFPLLKAKYIDTGKVRYVMRLLPIRSLDGPSYKLDLCVPPQNWFAAVDLLFRNQPQWDSEEYPVTDPHAGLIRMARILGLSEQQADACMNSTAHDAAINKVEQDAIARYQADSTPTFVIDFKKVELPQKSWEEAQAATLCFFPLAVWLLPSETARRDRPGPAMARHRGSPACSP
jgi:protein-disulfide isomerase